MYREDDLTHRVKLREAEGAIESARVIWFVMKELGIMDDLYCQKQIDRLDKILIDDYKRKKNANIQKPNS